MASASRSVVKRFPIGAQCTGSCRLEEHAYQLLCACASGNLTLLLHCAKKCGNPFKNCDSLGRNTLHIAAMYGHNVIVEWILERQLVDVNCCDIESRWTPLHYSIHFGQPGTAILLMKVCGTCLCKYCYKMCVVDYPVHCLWKIVKTSAIWYSLTSIQL